jgi:hypothetical protein
VSVALDEMLLLVGRLDDAPGFDTPRERFRRFLLDRVVDLETARALIDDCQRSVGEQRHRALQDLVVLVGRLLRFEIAFGTFETPADGLAAHGQWRSPGLLTVILDVRTEQTSGAPLDSLARALAAANAAGDSDPRIALIVVARQYAGRNKLGTMVAGDTRSRYIRILTVDSLLGLAARVAADRMSHEEVVKLLRSDFALDFVVGLLDRPVFSRPAVEADSADLSDSVDRREPSRPTLDRREPAFWVVTITGNETAAPDRFLRSVIAHRRVLAVCETGRFEAAGVPGDWVCFFIPGQGIAGHAQLMSIVEDGAAVVRNASRFSRVYRLSDVTLYDRAIAEPPRGQRLFAVPPVDASLPGPCLAPIARPDFVALTTYRSAPAALDRPRSTSA